MPQSTSDTGRMIEVFDKYLKCEKKKSPAESVQCTRKYLSVALSTVARDRYAAWVLLDITKEAPTACTGDLAEVLKFADSYTGHGLCFDLLDPVDQTPRKGFIIFDKIDGDYFIKRIKY